MLTDWQATLVEAIETAEAIGMTDDSPQSALVLIREPDKARLFYTLRECKEELSKLLTPKTQRRML